MLDRKQVVDQVERSIIRSAIASMPTSVKLLAFAAVLLATYFFGGQ